MPERYGLLALWYCAILKLSVVTMRPAFMTMMISALASHCRGRYLNFAIQTADRRFIVQSRENQRTYEFNISPSGNLHR